LGELPPTQLTLNIGERSGEGRVSTDGDILRDPEVLRFVDESERLYPANANEADATENRRIYDRMCAVFRSPRPPELLVHDRELTSPGCPPPVQVREYHKQARSDRKDAWVLYLHGGGFVVGGLESHDDICAEICAKSGFPVMSVAYRLAPEHVFPAALDDAWLAYEFLSEVGQRIIVAGDSAGANLCAAICIRARRLRREQPIKQVLIYPQLGFTSDTLSYREHSDAPMLRAVDCERYRYIYSGGRVVPEALLAEFAPLAATSFAGLAPAFIVTADIDPLRDDGRLYAMRLMEAGIPAEWRNEPQLVHGYLRARHLSHRAGESFSAVIAAIAAEG
jgi:acetyl esterase